MAEILSYRLLRLSLNGHRVWGFAPVDEPVTLEGTEDLFTRTRGPDGTLITSSSGYVGGELTIHLLPTSQSALWFVRERQRVRRGMARYIDGNLTLDDLSAQLRGGVLVDAPPVIIPKKHYVATIDFEVVNVQMEGVRYSPAPSVSA